MIDFKLDTENLIRRDYISITTDGKKHKVMSGRQFKIEYMLHKDEFSDPKDPQEGVTFFCLYIPQIGMSYVDKTEALVFEALMECFEEDFILFFATKLNEEREKNDKR